MVKDYSNYKNIYFISYNGCKYEVTGNSNDSALRCLSKYLNQHIVYGLIKKIEVVGSANSPLKVVYKINDQIINKLEDVSYFIN